jgi:hypothetical protein
LENIKDSFRVDTPLEVTWSTLLDIERIAPSMPGAQLQEIEGDEFRGIVKVKVGPITAQYKGTAKLASVDEANRTITIDASGRDTRGQGNASATINVAMRDDGGGTVVDIDTALQVTGKVAQFGRGVMAEVSAKILKQFVENLERDVLSATPATEAPADATAGATGDAPAGPGPVVTNGAAHATGNGTGNASANGNGNGASERSAVRVIDAPEAQPIDLMDAAGGSMSKRLVPLLAALVALVLLRRRRSRRRARRRSA